MFRCLLRRRFLPKCSGSIVVSAPARTRNEALLKSLGALLGSLGWPLDPGGVLGGHWDLPWRHLEALEDLRSDFGGLGRL